MSPLDAAVREVERHAAAAGWDHDPTIFALVPTRDLMHTEPALAERLGFRVANEDGLTPVAQEVLTLDGALPDVLAAIDWPLEVVGAVLVLETVVVPDAAEHEAPETDAAAWAASRPDREEARVVVGVLRTGERSAALRWRSHDRPQDVVVSPDLAPALIDAVARSLQ